MSQRDSGWIQLYAEDNQEAADLHIQAFRLAEAIGLPVMVCMDGFILTHAMEEVDLPDQATVDGFLPPFVPRQVLDPADPVSIGAMVGPEAFMEVRYLANLRHRHALKFIPQVAEEFEAAFGRSAGGLVRSYRLEDAEIAVVALGSVLGTIKDAVDELRESGLRIGVLGISTFRPFPHQAVAEALSHVRRIVVLEKAFSIGVGGIVTLDVRTAMACSIPLHTVVAGLGGRPITTTSLVRALQQAADGDLEPLHFLDLNREVVRAELSRVGKATPTAAAIDRRPR
jgi:pyruvate ferredoxin oxidoreductase alpha subunit